jgi:hypothetical protein
MKSGMRSKLAKAVAIFAKPELDLSSIVSVAPLFLGGFRSIPSGVVAV